MLMANQVQEAPLIWLRARRRAHEWFHSILTIPMDRAVPGRDRLWFLSALYHTR